MLAIDKKAINGADALLTCSMRPHKNVAHGCNLLYLLYAYKVVIASEIFVLGWLL